MKASLWIWTVICVVVAGGLIWFVLKDTNYSGRNITLTTDDNSLLTINAESVTLEAASGNFFVMRRLSGETIVGTPTQKPLGWDEDEYYRTEPTQIQGGTWLVEKGGDITIHLSSPGNMTVQEALNDDQKTSASLLIGFLIFFLWLFGLHISKKK